MFKTVLLAVDGSDHATKATRAAGEIAERFDARLVILHVLLSHASADELGSLPAAKSIPEALRERLDAARDLPRLGASMAGETFPVPIPPGIVEAVAEQVLEAARRDAETRGVKAIDCLTEAGDAAKRILHVAEREKADLIVLGCRGLGEIKGLFLGSVSHKVSQLAAAPCLMVK